MAVAQRRAQAGALDRPSDRRSPRQERCGRRWAGADTKGIWASGALGSAFRAPHGCAQSRPNPVPDPVAVRVGERPAGSSFGSWRAAPGGRVAPARGLAKAEAAGRTLGHGATMTRWRPGAMRCAPHGHSRLSARKAALRLPTRCCVAARRSPGRPGALQGCVARRTGIGARACGEALRWLSISTLYRQRDAGAMPPTPSR